MDGSDISLNFGESVFYLLLLAYSIPLRDKPTEEEECWTEDIHYLTNGPLLKRSINEVEDSPRNAKYEWKPELAKQLKKDSHDD